MAIDMKALARVGAEARLKELLAEVAEIQRTFPGLGGVRRGRPPVAEGAAPKAAVKRGRRKAMTAAEKKAVSERMRKYWAARRKEKRAQA